MNDLQMVGIFLITWLLVKGILDTFGVSTIIALYVAWDFLAKLCEATGVI